MLVCADWFFLADMCLSFFTAYFESDLERPITNNRLIAWEYLKSYVWHLSVCPHDAPFETN